MGEAVRAFVGVGANLGDAQATVGAALQALQRLPQSRWGASSSLYRSAPVDAPGPQYINAAAEDRAGSADSAAGNAAERAEDNAPQPMPPPP